MERKDNIQDMGGTPLVCHLFVPVRRTFLWNMLRIVQLMAFPRSNTMSFVTLLPLSYQRFATVLVLSLTCSPLLERLFHLLQLLLKMVQDWMLLRMVFNPNASSYRGSSLSSLYHRLEKEKRRKYEQRIRDVEMGCFTPLVFSTFGGMSTICNIFFKRLASLLADKKDVFYSVVMSWLHCRVNFSLLRSAIDCL